MGPGRCLKNLVVQPIHFRTNDILRDPITGSPAKVTEFDPPLLFDLSTDRGETTNIAQQKPEVLQRMIEEYYLAMEDIMGKSK